jgi:hypothetical protein
VEASVVLVRRHAGVPIIASMHTIVYSERWIIGFQILEIAFIFMTVFYHRTIVDSLLRDHRNCYD